MRKNILSIYAFTVCFVSLMCEVIILGLFSYNLVKVVSPGLTVSAHELRQVSSNSEFRTAFKNTRHIPEDEGELSQLREQENNYLLNSEKHYGLQKIVFYGIILVINLVMYITHWRIGKNSMASASGEIERNALNPL